ncbi:MAG: SPOR domain-containing protein [Acidobacteria bacterium]|nr:SPOR domain-containing protein [Acidobacteriota bacterium]
MTPVSDLEDANDTEITLGMGKMLALFFGLVILCAVFFGMGFSMGKNSAKPGPESTASAPVAAIRPSAAGKSPHPPSDSKTPQAPPRSTSRADRDSTGRSPTSAAAADSAATTAESAQGYFVQVAAVTKQEDAEALVEALKGRQYSAIVSSQPDKLFHVQVGPFVDIKDAEGMRAKLVSDGYNPILKK